MFTLLSTVPLFDAILYLMSTDFTGANTDLRTSANNNGVFCGLNKNFVLHVVLHIHVHQSR